MSKTYHYTQTGRFNMMSDDKQQQIVLVTPLGTVSELWPEDEAPYDPDSLPSEIAQEIRARAKKYLYKSNLKELLAKLDEIEANSAQIDGQFCLGKIEALANEIDRLQKKKRNYEVMAEEFADQMAAQGEQNEQG